MKKEIIEKQGSSFLLQKDAYGLGFWIQGLGWFTHGTLKG